MSSPSVNATFTPRREFVKNERQTSAFSLLSFSGVAFLRLSNFPTPVVHSLRQSLEPIRNFRQDTTQNLFEITVAGKPWSQPKSLETERLVVHIFALLLSNGFSFLSSIDYGREADDKLCLAFSKPSTPLSPDISNLSLATTLVPFAVSFPNTTTLRVISAPLHSTPSILQALRTAWPRGISGEKKIAESSFEFKLKGYSILREDTFPTDSLNHILNLLSSLDGQGFKLITSISVSGNHSRVKDLWIFGGVDEGSSPSSINTPSQRVASPPIIPPILTSSPHSVENSVLGGATLPLWDQFSPDGSLHQRAATSPEAYSGSAEDINLNASHTRFQSENLAQPGTGSSPIAPKLSVLRKKPPQTEIKDKVGSSPMRNNIILPEAGQDDEMDNGLRSSPEPARVLYSTPRQGLKLPHVVSPLEAEDHRDLAISDQLEMLEPDEREMKENIAERGEIPLDMENDPVTKEPVTAPLLGQPGSSVPPPLPSDTDDLSSRDHLLGPTVFRDTHYTDSAMSESTSSVPQVPLPILWGGTDGQQNNGNHVEGLERDVEVTPKHPAITLPQEQAVKTPAYEAPLSPPMDHRDTQTSMPQFPGGWAATPATELQTAPLDEPIGQETTDLDPTRASNYGLIGMIPTAPAPLEAREPIVDEAEPKIHTNGSAPGTDTLPSVVHKSPEEVLAQEEEKIPDSAAMNGHGSSPVTTEYNEPVAETAAPLPSGKPPSALKRLFNRASKRQSKLQGEAGVTKSLTPSQEEKLEKERRRTTLQKR